jgi:hypothetical protein
VVVVPERAGGLLRCDQYHATLDTASEASVSFDITREGLPAGAGNTTSLSALTCPSRPGPVPISPLDRSQSGIGAFQNPYANITHGWHLDAEFR